MREGNVVFVFIFFFLISSLFTILLAALEQGRYISNQPNDSIWNGFIATTDCQWNGLVLKVPTTLCALRKFKSFYHDMNYNKFDCRIREPTWMPKVEVFWFLLGRFKSHFGFIDARQKAPPDGACGVKIPRHSKNSCCTKKKESTKYLMSEKCIFSSGSFVGLHTIW
jgi:hypothetical protein